jgi:hypothetical protein
MRMASTVKPAIGPGHCLTAATPRIRPSFQRRVAQMRTDEIVIGLSDQCDRNYSLDRSRLGLYYARKVEPSTRRENSDGAQRRHAEGFIPGHSEIDRLFVDGVLWIARVGKPQRAPFFAGSDHDWHTDAAATA